MKNRNNEWMADYKEFIQTEDSTVPAIESERVFMQIHVLLNPKAWVIFLKILFFHLITGYLSLAICHQFDMNPFNTSYSLDNWVMSFASHEACMVFCGVLFISLSIVVAGYFLTIEEVRSLKNMAILQTLTLGLISLGLFTAFGAELIFSFALFWLLGIILGGFITTGVVWKLRQT